MAFHQFAFTRKKSAWGTLSSVVSHRSIWLSYNCHASTCAFDIFSADHEQELSASAISRLPAAAIDATEYFGLQMVEKEGIIANRAWLRLLHHKRKWLNNTGTNYRWNMRQLQRTVEGGTKDQSPMCIISHYPVLHGSWSQSQARGDFGSCLKFFIPHRVQHSSRRMFLY